MRRLKKGIVIMITITMMLFQNINVLAATTDKVIFTDSNFEQAIRDNLGKATGDITEGDMGTITALNLYNYTISNLNGIQYATNLKSLDAGITTISDISYLGNLTHLEQLNISDSNISDISCLSNLTQLMTLNLRNNNITDISALSGLTNLSMINLAHNNISDISSLKNKIKLTGLTLSYNPIQDITNLGTDINLTSLSLTDSKISDITIISNLTQLQYLAIDINSIHDISPLSGETTLKYLYLSENNIDDISPLSGLTNLLKLYISNNNITDLTPLQNIVNVEYLYLADNKISDLTPLSSLNKLKEINLSSNKIANIAPLSGIINSNLQFVNLGTNKLLNDILALTGIPSNTKVYYDGYVTEKFVDENNNLIQPETEIKETIDDSYMGTNKVSGQFNSKEVLTFDAETFDGYTLNDSSPKTVTLDNSHMIDEVIFKYITTTPSAVVLGSYQVKYVDESNSLIEPPTVKKNLSLGTYTATAKSFSNYILNDNSTKSVTLTDIIRKTIVFNYKKKTTTPTTPTTTTPGSVTIKYIDQDGNNLDTPDLLDNLDLGTYTEYAKSFDGYSLIGDSSQTATLTESNLNQTIIFNYKKKSTSHHHTSSDPDPVIPPKTPVVTEVKKEDPIILMGSYIVRFVDEADNSLLTPEVNKYNFALGTYIEPSLYFDGYELNDQETKSITLDKDHLNGVIEFKYAKIKIPEELPKTGDNSKTNATPIILLLSALSSLFFILKKRA